MNRCFMPSGIERKLADRLAASRRSGLNDVIQQSIIELVKLEYLCIKLNELFKLRLDLKSEEMQRAEQLLRNSDAPVDIGTLQQYVEGYLLLVRNRNVECSERLAVNWEELQRLVRAYGQIGKVLKIPIAKELESLQAMLSTIRHFTCVGETSDVSSFVECKTQLTKLSGDALSSLDRIRVIVKKEFPLANDAMVERLTGLGGVRLSDLTLDDLRELHASKLKSMLRLQLTDGETHYQERS